VCAADGLRKRPDGCWYDLVVDALRPLAIEEDADDGDGRVWRYRKGPDEPVTPVATQPDALPSDVPPWLRKAAPPQSAPLTLSPSTAYAEAPAAATRSLDERRRALKRGTLVHRMLQSLPDLPPERRDDAARRYLSRSAKELSESERDDLLRHVLDVIGHSGFAALFGAGSRAEVPIVGRLVRDGQPLHVSGQVDRLVVAGARVMIADFKTNHPAPQRIDDVPPGYVTQLALYRAVLAKLYPERTVSAALVWTSDPNLMEIPGPAMDAALHTLKRS
jgi:ATP-dependent helicase/nuclease subunit A